MLYYNVKFNFFDSKYGNFWTLQKQEVSVQCKRTWVRVA